MEGFLQTYQDLLMDLNFRSFQDALSQKVYDVLGQAFAAGENEVSLVSRLVGAIDKKRFNQLRFYGQKIHGARSYVEFNYRDKPTTKEIADMVIISIASRKRERILQRISFVQNKVSRNQKWEVDEEQLFLLKNFPKFSGNRGIFRLFSGEDVVFFNHSGCLGAFGLFMSPGEMMFMSAPLLAELKRNKEIALDDARLPETVVKTGSGIFPYTWDYRSIRNLVYVLREFPSGHFLNSENASTLPILGNSIFLRDIYDFTRNWTQFNIGEVTYAFDKVVNPTLDKFANFLLRSVGVNEHVDLPLEGIEGKFDNSLALLVTHLDLTGE